jgi:mannitol/fructose-specific phosphotransferase system IIA component (Ntr-type)
VYAYSEAGIEWDSPDGKLCKFVLLIITPIGEDDLQVQILSALAHIMAAPQNRNMLLIEHDPERIKSILFNALPPR